jgi:phosphoribosyl 1,2-cyclic phosphodiesterase
MDGLLTELLIFPLEMMESSMFLRVIGSSSKGNAYILESETGSLLIECGIPFKKIQRALDFNLSGVLGVIATHSHADHTGSAKEIMKIGIDLFVTIETANALDLSGHRLNIVEPLKQFAIGDFIILGFPTEHDCPGSVGYFIVYKPTGERTLFLTDSFYSKYKFPGLNYIMIEANYIKETLDANIAAGLIDERMKPRLLQSHFSLEHVKEFLQANDLSQVREIILLHLSDSNSDAARMIREIKELTGTTPKIAEPGLTVSLELFPY